MKRKPFEETIMYKKGQLGEYLIDKKLLKANRFIPYAPVGGYAHPFDRLCASRDKKNLMILEVKTISARKKYYDTGISIKHYNDYVVIQEKYKLPIFITFVDSRLKKIYGNTLNKLLEPKIIKYKGKSTKYPHKEENFSAVGKRIIYFPLTNMITIYELSDKEVEELQKYSNYGYKKDMQFKKGYNKWLRRRHFR